MPTVPFEIWTIYIFFSELKPLTYFSLEQLHNLDQESDVTDKLTVLAALQSLPPSTEWVEAVEQVCTFVFNTG